MYVCVWVGGCQAFWGCTASNITIWLKAKLNTNEGGKITITLFHLIILLFGVRWRWILTSGSTSLVFLKSNRCGEAAQG